MKRVGFQGGSSIFELGVASDMVCFFSVLREKVELSECELLLLERLYRRYLRFEELDEAAMLMLSFKDYLSRAPSSIAELKALGWKSEKSNLNTAYANFTDVFIKYFDGFDYCAESARRFYDDWGIYKPVRAIVCDMPDYMVEKLRSLDDYDNLGSSDAPFWLR